MQQVRTSRNTKHDEQTKLRALAHFASSGSITATAEATGLPKQTIHDWIGTEEGAELIGNVRTSLRHAVAADLVTVTRKAIAETLDRLEHGDEVVVANGEKIRRKVTAKDAMYIASNANSMHLMLTQDAKQVANANLKQLANDLIEAMRATDPAAQAKTIEHEPQAIEAEPVANAEPKLKAERRKNARGEGG